jgi:molybdopterin converting factor small subunit
MTATDIRVLFFAKWREQLGIDCLTVNFYELCRFKCMTKDANSESLSDQEASAQVSLNIADLIAYLLAQYDGKMAEVLCHSQTKCALNQVVVSTDDAQCDLQAGAEVAFFPPVTGG